MRRRTRQPSSAALTRPGRLSLFLADAGSKVDLVVRGVDLSAGMSHYLVDRVLAHPSITVHTATQVTALHGDTVPTRADVHHVADGDVMTTDCVGLFCFIGAEPATNWLTGIAVDEDGFVRTDRDLTNDDMCACLGPARPSAAAVRDERARRLRRGGRAVGVDETRRRRRRRRRQRDPLGPPCAHSRWMISGRITRRQA